MITLTEKRLRALEARMQKYEDDILELKKVAQTVNTLQNDVMLGKNASVKLLDNYVESHSKLIKKQNELEGKLREIQATCCAVQLSVEEAKKVDAALVEAQENLLISNVSIKQIIRSIPGDIEALKKELAGTGDKFGAIKNSIDVLQKSVVKAQTRAENAQEDATNALNKTLEHSASLIQNGMAKDIMAEGIQTNFRNLSTRMEQRFVEVDKKLCAPNLQKDYESQITEIKKDIATILSVTHSTAKVQDESKLNDKVSTMEKSLAQIFMLLKKYER